ncbi:TIGR04104 family putative zinc finger protein [Lentibacillus sp. CBA3610]|uniref:TIGR04104 family putative zinc finger protein n=1 Tax=Lentibacillus sp. CBA3610 TaxID=2518176 RepID=UPI0015957B01|nr:TIGR04104 family putative zinc finger protein [Lentibacillus sp. CBA3610]
MQKCENCNAAFSWSEIYKSLWAGYKPIKCNECGTGHKITISGRIIFVSLTTLSMVIFGLFLSPFRSILVTIGIALFILIIGSLLTPFFVTYKKFS